jgi:hypothetical protein
MNASKINLVVDNAICPSQEFVDEVLQVTDDSSSCCSLDDSFASILSTHSLDEQEDEILSLGAEDSYGDCRWKTTAEVTNNTSPVPPCRCPTPSSPKMPQQKISNAAIRNWMLQMPMDGSGHTFSKKKAADIVKEAVDLVGALDSPASTNPLVWNTVRINEILSKSA